MIVDENRENVFDTYRVPKQFNHSATVIDVVSAVSPETADKMNEEIRQKCAVLDSYDRDCQYSFADVISCSRD